MAWDVGIAHTNMRMFLNQEELNYLEINKEINARRKFEKAAAFRKD